MTRRIVILGSGMAGISLARELRRLDDRAEIVLLSREPGDFYSKPALSNALAGGKSAAALVLTPAARLAQELGVRIVGHTEVAAVDTGAKTVRATAGTFAYDALVLAVGASQRRLPMAGEAADAMLSVNNLADYARFRERLQGARRVAIIGAGLIGCEFANDLRLAGIDVDVHDVAGHPLGRLLPEQAAAMFRRRLEEAGVRFHLGTSVVRIDPAEQGHVLSTSAGTSARYDLVLCAIGLQPNIELARDAGLSTGVGIRTDRFLRSSVKDVYALGDCAEVEGLVLPYVLPITHGAKALARTLAGEPTPVRYPAMPVVVKTPACPAVICLPSRAGGAWSVAVEGDGLRGIHRGPDGETTDGFILLGTAVKERMSLAARVPGPLAGTALPML
jgi:rubredoxin-NAD+ reductase